MAEAFQPPPHRPPLGLSGRLQFKLRLLCDFQVLTVHRDVCSFLENMQGSTVVDIGCGLSPYRYLFRRYGVTYLGFDSLMADEFSCGNPEVRLLDGNRIPMPSESADGVLCTEVLEHILEPQLLISEMHRVLKPGGHILVTVPWAARFHYIPFDYWRYTPSALQVLFANFESADIRPRGTDIISICAKILVVALRQFKDLCHGHVWMIVPLTVSVPLAFCAILIGHAALLFAAGSSDDPLGYSVTARK